MRLKMSFLAIKENDMSGAKLTPLLTPKEHYRHSDIMMVAPSCCEDVFHRQRLRYWSELKE